jgi:hypothetical protein
MSIRNWILGGLLIIGILLFAVVSGIDTGIACEMNANGSSYVFLPLVMRALVCGDEPTPPGGSCPPGCSSCIGSTCAIDCAGTTCRDASIDCPPGFECEVTCAPGADCSGSTIHCPDQYACRVNCGIGLDVCENMVVNCSATGTCLLTCEHAACVNTQLTCGENACTATCTGTCSPVVNCGPSCNCVTP